ncbi:MAG: thioredoxin family protein [Gemmatimonadota bacterium]|nr:thioredoxin family protein [Gemmatimonadota bacterium]
MLVNEVLQWAALGAIALLLLGFMRQIALTQPSRFRGAVASGPQVGERMPNKALAAVTRALGVDRLPDGTLVAFVMESCVSCQRLLAEVTNREASEEPILIVAKRASPQFRAAIVNTGLPAMFDEGELWGSVGVTATPLVVRLAGDGRILAKGVTHDVDSPYLARP